jgi:GTP-binding protein Era
MTDNGQESTKCAYVGVFGAPNAGKSTLVNRIVGQKVAIVSPKVQTTRRRIRGVLSEGDTQLIFVDTPGLFSPNPKRPLERHIVGHALEEMEQTDMRLLAIDARKGVTPEVENAVAALARTEGRTVAALNKVDAVVQKDRLLEQAARLAEMYPFEEIFMISALTGEGVPALLSYFRKNAEDSPWMFPGDQASDAPFYFDLAETTRECLFYAVQEELPYGVAVVTESVEDSKEGGLIVRQVVYTARESHKRVIIGKDGALIKQIGVRSRETLKKRLGKDVHLYLYVKVKEGWQRDPGRYEN